MSSVQCPMCEGTGIATYPGGLTRSSGHYVQLDPDYEDECDLCMGSGEVEAKVADQWSRWA